MQLSTNYSKSEQYQTREQLDSPLIGQVFKYVPKGFDPVDTPDYSEPDIILANGDTVTVKSVWPIWYGNDRRDNPLVYVQAHGTGTHTHVEMWDLQKVG